MIFRDFNTLRYPPGERSGTIIVPAIYDRHAIATLVDELS